MATISSMINALQVIQDQSGDLEIFYHEHDLGRIYQIRSIYTSVHDSEDRLIALFNSRELPDETIPCDVVIDMRKEHAN